ncbi:Phage portal protein, lambda family [compost metagenome]
MQLHLIAAGAGWTYEMMTGDVREVSYTSARIRRLDYRREAEQEQWLHVIPKLIAPMVRAFSNACELAGRVKKADYNLRYATPKWEYTNPKDDVASDLDEIAGGLSSFSEKLRSRGYEPDEVFDELAGDIQKLRDRGILDVLLMMRKGKQMIAEPASVKP